MRDAYLVVAGAVAGVAVAALLVFLSLLDPASPEDVTRAVRDNKPPPAATVDVAPLQREIARLTERVARLDRQIEKLLDGAVILGPVTP